MPVEKLALRAHAHGVKPKQDAPQHFRRIKLLLACVKRLVLRLHKGIQVGKDGVLLRCQAVKVALVSDPPPGIQFLEHDLYDIDLPVRKVLVAAEKIFQEANVLGQPGADAEGLGRVHVLRACGVIPGLRL